MSRAAPPELLVLALDYYRQPQKYRQLTSPTTPLPAGITELLTANANSLADEHVDATAAALGSSPDECRAAVAFFLRQVLIEPEGDFYRRLGLTRNADRDQVRRHYQQLIRLFHPDRYPEADSRAHLESLASSLNEAYGTLRNPRRREAYDLTLPDSPGDDFGPTQSAEPATAQTQAAVAPPRQFKVSRRTVAWSAAVLVVAFGAWMLQQNMGPGLRMGESRAAPQALAPAEAGAAAARRFAGASPQLATPAGTSTGPALDDAADIPDADSRPEAEREQQLALLGNAGAIPLSEDVEPLAILPMPVASTGQERSPPSQESPAGSQLDTLVGQFISRYEAGDAAALSHLFTARAVFGDVRGRDDIADAYQHTFSRSLHRRMELTNLQWDEAGADGRTGTASVTLSVIPSDGSGPSRTTNTLRWRVVERDGEARIAALTMRNGEH